MCDSEQGNELVPLWKMIPASIDHLPNKHDEGKRLQCFQDSSVVLSLLSFSLTKYDIEIPE
jgi:hypothetical protein